VKPSNQTRHVNAVVVGSVRAVAWKPFTLMITVKNVADTSPKNQDALTAGYRSQLTTPQPRGGDEMWRLVA
jgi:hypothetical protein